MGKFIRQGFHASTFRNFCGLTIRNGFDYKYVFPLPLFGLYRKWSQAAFAASDSESLQASLPWNLPRFVNGIKEWQ